MKILQVVPYFPPAYAFGGPVKVAYDISQELSKTGNAVTVYTTDAKNLTERIDRKSYVKLNGVRTLYMRNLSMALVKKAKLFLTPEIFFQLEKDGNSFDIIHMHEYRTLQNILVARYAKKHHIPYVLQAHGSLPRFFGKQWFKWFYDSVFGYRILQNASKVIALSKVEAAQYAAMGVPKEKIMIVPNGINLSEFKELLPRVSFREKFRINKDVKLVIFIGRIHESKGLEMLAKAFAIVEKKIKNTKLVVIGPNDGYQEIFNKLLADLQIENKVILTGFLDKQYKLAALTEGDVFVTPNFHGFPITFLEACAAQIPLVTTSSELDWIDNNVGYIVKNSPEKLAEGICKILQNKTLQDTFRKNCSTVIKTFEISAVVMQIMGIYQATIDGLKVYDN